MTSTHTWMRHVKVSAALKKRLDSGSEIHYTDALFGHVAQWQRS